MPAFLRSLAVLALVSTATATAVLAAGPHEHGTARLDVAVEPGRITLELATPLDNLVGFERAPRGDAERQAALAAVKKLQAPDALFRIDPAAGCSATHVRLDSPELGVSDPAKGKAAGDHAELQGRFEFTCKAGAKAGFVELGLFDAFAAVKRVEVQVVTPRGQMKATLVRPAKRLALAR